ncbi:unnamed protein product [Lepeophtheirus salmonis]|uniref:(salmon louse) hypothetical protein n=1 Tax=Lepeophtheirus salmonis TaxID=72036 RepID=A0A7R8CF28_LEPSM|nr:unnamed protein product [Lepeophtheirus salmonis]CAF2797273.1 unnamed protein product [Lepeophtheirus salmonis]
MGKTTVHHLDPKICENAALSSMMIVVELENGEIRFDCSECFRRYRHHPSLFRHFKNAHPEKYEEKVSLRNKIKEQQKIAKTLGLPYFRRKNQKRKMNAKKNKENALENPSKESNELLHIPKPNEPVESSTPLVPLVEQNHQNSRSILSQDRQRVQNQSLEMIAIENQSLSIQDNGMCTLTNKIQNEPTSVDEKPPLLSSEVDLLFEQKSTINHILPDKGDPVLSSMDLDAIIPSLTTLVECKTETHSFHNPETSSSFEQESYILPHPPSVENSQENKVKVEEDNDRLPLKIDHEVIYECHKCHKQFIYPPDFNTHECISQPPTFDFIMNSEIKMENDQETLGRQSENTLVNYTTGNSFMGNGHRLVNNIESFHYDY